MTVRAYSHAGEVSSSVSAKLHQTHIEGSATASVRMRQLRFRALVVWARTIAEIAPKKLVRTATPAHQNIRLIPKKRESQLVASSA